MSSPSLQVLLYHDILDLPPPGPAAQYATTIQTLQAHLEWLHKNNYRIIHSRDWPGALTLEQSPASRCCILTFDGPYRHWPDTLFPFLLQAGIPVTLFLTTGLVGQDLTAHAACTWQQLDELLAQRHPNDPDRPLVEIGSHTCDHSPLVRQPRETRKDFERRLRHEIIDSANQLQQNLNIAVSLFAPPKGLGMDDPLVLDLCKEAGYTTLREGHPREQALRRRTSTGILPIHYADRSDLTPDDFVRRLRAGTAGPCQRIATRSRTAVRRVFDRSRAAACRLLRRTPTPAHEAMHTATHQCSPSRFMGERTTLQILPRLVTPTTERVLDLACGTGEYRFLFQGRKYIGIDRSNARFSTKTKENTGFLIGNALELPLQPSSVDAVYCNYAFEYFPDPERAMNEIARVLTPGGRAWLTIPTPIVTAYELPLELLHRIGLFRSLRISAQPGFRGFLPEAIQRLAAGAGMEVVDQYSTSGPVTFYLKLIWLWLRLGRYVLLSIPVALAGTRPSLFHRAAHWLRNRYPILPRRATRHATSMDEFLKNRDVAYRTAGISERIYELVLEAALTLDSPHSRRGTEYGYLLMRSEP